MAVGKSPTRRESNDDFYVNSETMMDDQRIDSNENHEQAAETMQLLHKVEEAQESLKSDNLETPKTIGKSKVTNSKAKNDQDGAWTPLD